MTVSLASSSLVKSLPGCLVGLQSPDAGFDSGYPLCCSIGIPPLGSIVLPISRVSCVLAVGRTGCCFVGSCIVEVCVAGHSILLPVFLALDMRLDLYCLQDSQPVDLSEYSRSNLSVAASGVMQRPRFDAIDDVGSVDVHRIVLAIFHSPEDAQQGP